MDEAHQKGIEDTTSNVEQFNDFEILKHDVTKNENEMNSKTNLSHSLNNCTTPSTTHKTNMKEPQSPVVIRIDDNPLGNAYHAGSIKEDGITLPTHQVTKEQNRPFLNNQKFNESPTQYTTYDSEACDTCQYATNNNHLGPSRDETHELSNPPSQPTTCSVPISQKLGKVARTAATTTIASTFGKNIHGGGADQAQLVALSKSNGIVGQLTSAIVSLQQQQQVSNYTNSRMNSINLMLNVSNYARNAKLSRQQGELKARIEEGEALVRSMEYEIDRQRNTVSCIGSDLSTQKQSINELETGLEAQKAHVEDLAIQYKEEMENQRKMIESQRKTLELLQASKFKHDAIIDMAIVLLSMFSLNTPMVDWPIRFLSYSTSFLTGTKNKKPALSNKFLRMISFFMIARTMRVYAMKKGIHNYVGTSASYFSFLKTQMVENGKVLNNKGKESIALK